MSGRSLSRFLYSPLDGMLVHRRITPSIKFPGTHLYPWVERGLPNNTTQYLRSGLEPVPLALGMKPPRLYSAGGGIKSRMKDHLEGFFTSHHVIMISLLLYLTVSAVLLQQNRTTTTKKKLSLPLVTSI